VRVVSPEALSLLSEYEFPGNVRELSNIIERAVIVSGGKQIEVGDLPETIRAAVMVQGRREKPLSLAEVEAEYVAEILAVAKGNKTEAARILGISRKNLYEKLARLRKDDG
jgi:DNA-binding NtrC family response regulator